jgi:hypothetical protein
MMPTSSFNAARTHACTWSDGKCRDISIVDKTDLTAISDDRMKYLTVINDISYSDDWLADWFPYLKVGARGKTSHNEHLRDVTHRNRNDVTVTNTANQNGTSCHLTFEHLVASEASCLLARSIVVSIGPAKSFDRHSWSKSRSVSDSCTIRQVNCTLARCLMRNPCREAYLVQDCIYCRFVQWTCCATRHLLAAEPCFVILVHQSVQSGHQRDPVCTQEIVRVT